MRTLGLGAGGALCTGFYTWRVEPHWLEIVKRALPMRNLPKAMAGLKLVQLSDIHVGPRVADDYVTETFARVAELGADIVVMTGDFVTYQPNIFAQMERVYRSFPRGRLATVGILGNHDYGINWAHPEVAARVAAIAQDCGITMLRNQTCAVGALQILGLDDLWGGRFAGCGPILAKLDPDAPALILSHNPDTVDLPVWHGYRGWILAGHTHGGQCKPPFLPPPLLPVRNRRYTAGAFEIAPGRMLYVNRGVGHLLPVRFNVRPEVTLFELQGG